MLTSTPNSCIVRVQTALQSAVTVITTRSEVIFIPYTLHSSKQDGPWPLSKVGRCQGNGTIAIVSKLIANNLTFNDEEQSDRALK